MNFMTILKSVFLTGILILPIRAQYAGWSGTGVINIITTQEGANLPGTVSETDFPVLVRLHKDFFNFAQAKPGGDDIRFSSGTTPLSYEIEAWDGSGGTASIWVKIPAIIGNARQAINMHWGNAAAASESNGAGVFEVANGYLGVWHLSDVNSLADATSRNNNGTNNGTTTAQGLIGAGANFDQSASQFIDLPPAALAGMQGTATFSLWAKNSSLLGKTNAILFGALETEGYELITAFLTWDQNRVKWDFGDADPNWLGNDALEKVTDLSPLAEEWHHWVFTHNSTSGDMYIYLDGQEWHSTGGRTEVLGSPTEFTLGTNKPRGWWQWFYDGVLDEFEVSNTERSAHWNKLAYENQKPMQTLTGLLVQEGSTFSVAQPQVTVPEGTEAGITVTAGGAQKIYWVLKENGSETVVAVDRLTYPFSAGRVAGNNIVLLEVRAVYPTEAQSQEITVTIQEAIPEPEFTLTAPASWNGRDPVQVTAQVSNQAALDAAGVGTLSYSWKTSGMAVAKDASGTTMNLTRAFNSGTLLAELTIENGGTGIRKTVEISVTEPASDAWVLHTPTASEKPEAGQFFARAGTSGKCTIHYNGTQAGASSVYLKALEGTTEVDKTTASTTAGVYQLSVEVDAKMAKYSVEFGTADGGETQVATVGNLVCGDAYILQGQSNTEASDGVTHPYSSEYIISYGNGALDSALSLTKAWGPAVSNAWAGHPSKHLHIGYWGMEMAKNLLEEFQIPLFIINGAQGGTRPDQHQKDFADASDWTVNANNIYGRLLWRLQQAKLTHGIRGLLWHQGENSQGAQPERGLWGWEPYQEEWMRLAGDWKMDYPNIRNFYLFQIRPACGGGGIPANMLRDVQRTLPEHFSNAHIMTTVGIQPGSGCHYSAEGYVVMADLIYPLVARDNYGKVYTSSITPPAIQRAYYNGDVKTAVTLEFDQPVVWEEVLKKHFYLDELSMDIATASTDGNNLTLNLTGASDAETMGYLHSGNFSQTDPVLDGANGVAALTFWNYPIYPDENFIPIPVEKPEVKKTAGITGRLKHGTLYINFKNMEEGPVRVQLYDLKGRTTFQKKFQARETGSVQFEVPNLGQGIHVLRIIQHGGESFIRKIPSL